MRKITFRAKRTKYGSWHYGSLLICEDGTAVIMEAKHTWMKTYVEVDPKTIGQFTGLTDKNGKPIYEGDIVEFYELKTYCINPDCEPHLLGYSERLHKKIKAVRFEDGIFGFDGEYLPIEALSGIGEWGSDEEFMTELKNDPYFDANGYDLGSVAGIKVIGNIHDNPDLIEKGGE